MSQTPQRLVNGTRVRTKRKFYGDQRVGTVVDSNGAYIYVRLDFKNVVIEAYDVELEVLDATDQTMA